MQLGMILLGMVSLSSISFHGATWSLPYQKTIKQLPSSRLRLTPNGPSGSFKRILFLKALGCKAMLFFLGGGVRA